MQKEQCNTGSGISHWKDLLKLFFQQTILLSASSTISITVAGVKLWWLKTWYRSRNLHICLIIDVLIQLVTLAQSLKCWKWSYEINVDHFYLLVCLCMYVGFIGRLHQNDKADFYRTCCTGPTWAKYEPTTFLGRSIQPSEKNYYFSIGFGGGVRYESCYTCEDCYTAINNPWRRQDPI